MTDKPKVTIDGKDFEIDSLSDDAKAQLTSLNVVDQKIVDNQRDAAILQTARMAYAKALNEALPKQ